MLTTILFLFCAVQLYHYDRLTGKYVFWNVVGALLVIVFVWQRQNAWPGFTAEFYDTMLTLLYAAVAGTFVGILLSSRRKRV